MKLREKLKKKGRKSRNLKDNVMKKLEEESKDKDEDTKKKWKN